MATCIIKLNDPRTDKDWYLLWSSIVDAPVSFGCTLAKLLEIYPVNEDEKERLKQKGTSSLAHASAAVVIEGNRAGRNDSCISVEQIIDAYCEAQLRPEFRPEGT